MAVAVNNYEAGYKEYLTSDADYDSDTFKVLLTTSSYTPSVDHDFVDDITNELSGGNYARETLASVTFTRSGATLTFDASDTTFSALTAAEIRYAVIFKDTGADGTSPLLMYVDFGTNESASAEDLVIEWHADGITTIGV